jgi:hypothetical protein
MSQVARVFVVLNLLLAAGFFFAAATFLGAKDSYKQKFEQEAAARIDDNRRNQATIAQKDGQIATLDQEKRALSEQRGSLEGTANSQRTQIASLEAQLKEKDTQIATLTTVNDGHGRNIQNLQAQNASLVEQNTTLARERNDAVARMEKALGELSDEQRKNLAANNTIADQEKAIAKLNDEVSHLKLMTDFARRQGINFENLQLLPPLHGSVVNADNSLKLVQANIGKSAGVERGAVLDIVRGGQYIGRFRVDTVFDNQCAGLVTMLTPGQMVQVGDRVTNTLN